MRRGAGLGSTQAAAGMLVPFLEGFGGPLLPLATRSLEMYDTFVERVTRDAGVGVGYRRGGSLQVATSDEHADELAAACRRAAPPGRRLRAARCAAVRESRTAAVGGRRRARVLVKSHGFVVTSDLSGALTAAAIKHGMRIRVPARVHADRSRSDDVEIAWRTTNRSLTEPDVVVAAGSWSGQIDIDGAPPLPVRPVRGQLLQLAWDGPPLQRIVWGPRCYLVPFPPAPFSLVRRWKKPDSMSGPPWPEYATCSMPRAISSPHCGTPTFAGARVGLRPATSDGMPIIGRSARCGVVYATGTFATASCWRR